MLFGSSTVPNPSLQSVFRGWELSWTQMVKEKRSTEVFNPYNLEIMMHLLIWFLKQLKFYNISLPTSFDWKQNHILFKTDSLIKPYQTFLNNSEILSPSGTTGRGIVVGLVVAVAVAVAGIKVGVAGVGIGVDDRITLPTTFTFRTKVVFNEVIIQCICRNHQ